MIRLSRRIRRGLAGPFFHGGVPGLVVGESLLPPARTRHPNYLGAYVTRLGGSHDPLSVYVTTELHTAKLYAFGYLHGWVYRVQPLGALLPDPDCKVPGLSWRCKEARVVEVVIRGENERG